MFFVEKALKTPNHLIRLIIGKNNGKFAWWILKINSKKFAVFEIKVAKASIGNLEDYGEVLYKGWGKTAPADILETIKEKYS